jgi:hypothetical protein
VSTVINLWGNSQVNIYQLFGDSVDLGFHHLWYNEQ